MKTTSGSEILFNTLSEMGIGFRFNHHSLMELNKEKNLGLSEGTISGFSTRAYKKGMTAIVGKIKGANKKDTFMFEIMDINPWVFKSKGIGSLPGREIHAHKVVNTTYNMFDIEEPKETMIIVKSLSDRLMELAIEVNNIENKKEKSINDFTTNEIIDELRRRAK